MVHDWRLTVGGGDSGVEKTVKVSVCPTERSAGTEDDSGSRAPLTTPRVELEGVDELSADVFRAFITTLRLHRQLMMSALGGRGTHPGRGICLHLLAAHGHCTQRDLAESMHLSRPTVSKMVQSMEKSGLVERRPDESDQRLTRVELTAAGRSLEKELRGITARLVNETVGALCEDDRRELARLLGELAASMRGAIGARAAAPPNAAPEDEAAAP
jgi:MarR family transcriptional regulator, organic hydroperoxide resistance regulator